MMLVHSFSKEPKASIYKTIISFYPHIVVEAVPDICAIVNLASQDVPNIIPEKLPL